jgi:hypothetical protein
MKRNECLRNRIRIERFELVPGCQSLKAQLGFERGKLLDLIATESWEPGEPSPAQRIWGEKKKKDLICDSPHTN